MACTSSTATKNAPASAKLPILQNRNIFRGGGAGHVQNSIRKTYKATFISKNIFFIWCACCLNFLSFLFFNCSYFVSLVNRKSCVKVCAFFFLIQSLSKTAAPNFWSGGARAALALVREFQPNKQRYSILPSFNFFFEFFFIFFKSLENARFLVVLV